MRQSCCLIFTNFCFGFN